MPRPRIHKDNAARQKAYRERLKKGLVPGAVSGRPGDIVGRVMQAEGRMASREA